MSYQHTKYPGTAEGLPTMATDGDNPTVEISDVQGWRKSALCRQADPELWFPEPGEDDRAAKLICGWCPVRSVCLAWAMDTNEPYGIAGGLTPEERRRARRAAAAVELDGEAA
jgi:WhiB family redox-sensing transcriptional regulator